MLNLPDLIGAIQTNCDVSDAKYAGDYGLCTYLLKMREYYRWEHEIPYFSEVPKDDLGTWLTERERHWEHIESAPWMPLPLTHGMADPFDSDAVNHDLVPQGYVYSAGYGRFHKPVFFLGRLLRRDEWGDVTIFISSCEYARELAAPPAMLQDRTIFVRQESARRLVWEKIDEWRWTRQDNAMGRAIACHASVDDQVLLDRMTDDAMNIMILHELGEVQVGRWLGEEWTALIESFSRSPAEIVARAVRDHLADCRSTLPALLDRGHAGALHFYFANVDGARKKLFSDMQAAYQQWVRGGDVQTLRATAQRDEERWSGIARSLLNAHRADPACARTEAARLLADVNLSS